MSALNDNLYVNLDGLPHGGTLYGLFLNSFGAGVFGLGLAPGKSTGLLMSSQIDMAADALTLMSAEVSVCSALLIAELGHYFRDRSFLLVFPAVMI